MTNLPVQVGTPEVDFKTDCNTYRGYSENQLACALKKDIPGLTNEKSQDIAEMAANAEEHREVSIAFRVSSGTSDMTQFRIQTRKDSNVTSVSWWALRAVASVVAKQRIETHHKKVKRALGIVTGVKRWIEVQEVDRGLDANDIHKVQDHLCRAISAHPKYCLVNA